MGSAINDTTRQVPVALGVAVIGSVVTSVYSQRIFDLAGVFGLAPPEQALAESSLGGAQRVATELGGQADAFVAAANDSFVDALSVGLRLTAVVILLAAVMAWRFLPSPLTTDPRPSRRTVVIGGGEPSSPEPAVEGS